MSLGTGNVGRYDEAIRLRNIMIGIAVRMACWRRLKAAGYATAVMEMAHGLRPEFSPLDQGFERFVGILGGNVELPIASFRICVFYRDRERWPRDGYLTDIWRDEAVNFIRDKGQGASRQPFFLYLFHGAALSVPAAPSSGRSDATAEQWLQARGRTRRDD